MSGSSLPFGIFVVDALELYPTVSFVHKSGKINLHSLEKGFTWDAFSHLLTYFDNIAQNKPYWTSQNHQCIKAFAVCTENDFTPVAENAILSYDNTLLQQPHFCKDSLGPSLYIFFDMFFLSFVRSEWHFYSCGNGLFEFGFYCIITECQRKMVMPYWYFIPHFLWIAVYSWPFSIQSKHRDSSVSVNPSDVISFTLLLRSLSCFIFLTYSQLNYYLGTWSVLSFIWSRERI